MMTDVAQELDTFPYLSTCLPVSAPRTQVLDVSWKGDQLWGTIEVLPTPSGLLLWELYSRVGGRLGRDAYLLRAQQQHITYP